ncbi:MAG TPA: MFS transporter [Thermoplasmata archaeon]|nr:MFS transporter [Thermoplasmata archaeon]
MPQPPASVSSPPAVLPGGSTPETSERTTARYEASILLLTTIGILMVAVDSTIVILALPTMARELSSPLETIIWTILIYLLITTALTTQAGRLGDVLGRGRVYNTGFAIFTIGSALCGLAPTAQILIAARAVQAIGGAVLFANAPAVITAAIPAVRRGRAFGFIVFGFSVGAILGILLGGVITTLIGWRYIFFINLPIGAVAIALGLRTLPKTERYKVTFDVPGFVLFSAALSLICYGAIEIASFGATGTYLLYLAVGLALVPVFIIAELGTDRPMVDLRQLRDRVLGFSLAAGFLQALGYLSVIFLLTMYLQGLRGLSPLDASVLLVPGYIVGAVCGPYFGRRVDRFGPRAFMTAGIVAMAGAVLCYSSLTVHSWLGWIPAISLVQGVGAGMFYPANNAAIMSRASPSALGSISGLRGTLSNMGTLLSFVLALTIASASVPRYIAYAVFLGTTNLVGGVGEQFMDGIRVALWGSVAILTVAAILSWSRGADQPTAVPSAQPRAGTNELRRLPSDPPRGSRLETVSRSREPRAVDGEDP